MITFDDLSRAALAAHAPNKVPAISPSPTSAASPPPPQPHASSSAPSSSSCPPEQSLLLPRTQVLHLGAAVGTLCSSLLAHAPLDPPGRDPLPKGVDESITFPPTLVEIPDSFWSSATTNNRTACPNAAVAGRAIIARSMGSVFLALFLTAATCGVDLRSCILKKLELNGKKYPVELCRGKSGKYTDYSDKTGITADRRSQSTVGAGGDAAADGSEQSEGDDSATKGGGDDQSIAALTRRIRAFATDRQWSRYHTPRNIVLAMMGEVGELAELFQWLGDGSEGATHGLTNFAEEDIDHVRQELADVTIYLMRLADVTGVDLAREAMELSARSEDDK